MIKCRLMRLNDQCSFRSNDHLDCWEGQRICLRSCVSLSWQWLIAWWFEEIPYQRSSTWNTPSPKKRNQDGYPPVIERGNGNSCNKLMSWMWKSSEKNCHVWLPEGIGMYIAKICKCCFFQKPYISSDFHNNHAPRQTLLPTVSGSSLSTRGAWPRGRSTLKPGGAAYTKIREDSWIFPEMVGWVPFGQRPSENAHRNISIQPDPTFWMVWTWLLNSDQSFGNHI